MATVCAAAKDSRHAFEGKGPAQTGLLLFQLRGVCGTDGEDDRQITRPPGDTDLVSLARELNRLGVAYVVVGGFAINRLGFVRATYDLDLLIAKDLASQALVKKALEILPDKAIRELGQEDMAQWVVVRVNDVITVDLMTDACGVTYDEARSGIEVEEFDGVPIPFASASLMLRMKQGSRGEGRIGRSFSSSFEIESASVRRIPVPGPRRNTAIPRSEEIEMERAKRLELSTSTLARWCSTN
jgi:hypothetical protein